MYVMKSLGRFCRLGRQGLVAACARSLWFNSYFKARVEAVTSPVPGPKDPREVLLCLADGTTVMAVEV